MAEPLTWGRVKAWARDNEVPDEAIMEGQDRRKFVDLDYSPPEEAIPAEDGYEGEPATPPTFILQVTWG